jgi:hypothetical protein
MGKSMSGWGAIRSVSPDVLLKRRIMSEVISYYTGTGRLSASTAHIFQIDFYKFLSKLQKTNANLFSHILPILLTNPDLAKYVRRKKLDEFMKRIEELAQTDDSRELICVTLFYENLLRYGSFRSAYRATRRYRMDNFSYDFIKSIRTKYPFLFTATHLGHVLQRLQTAQYAYNLTKHGIREEYPE